MRWLRGGRRAPDSSSVKQARAERVESEQLLEEALERREYVDALGARVDHVLRVNGFGAAASAAMRRRQS